MRELNRSEMANVEGGYTINIGALVLLPAAGVRLPTINQTGLSYHAGTDQNTANFSLPALVLAYQGSQFVLAGVTANN